MVGEVRESATASALDLYAGEAAWPGRMRRRPRITEGNYLLLSAIAASLRDARDRYVRSGAGVLDVGCEDMPYLPLFADVAADYAGADLEPRPGVRYVCPAEALTAPDDAFDLVLCTQVLEHVERPARALGEIARVLRPGGHAFISTHGVYPFHPHPTDYWRWTQMGLEQLVADTPGLELVELVPHRGSAACLALLVANYVEIAATHARVRVLGAPVVAFVNACGLLLDRLTGGLHYPRSHTLVANFLIVARKRELEALTE